MAARAGIERRNAHQPVYPRPRSSSQPRQALDTLDLQGRGLDPRLLAVGFLDQAPRSCRGRQPNGYTCATTFRPSRRTRCPRAAEVNFQIGVDVFIRLARQPAPPKLRPARPAASAPASIGRAQSSKATPHPPPRPPFRKTRRRRPGPAQGNARPRPDRPAGCGRASAPGPRLAGPTAWDPLRARPVRPVALAPVPSQRRLLSSPMDCSMSALAASTSALMFASGALGAGA